jgi:hypothetical protein
MQRRDMHGATAATKEWANSFSLLTHGTELWAEVGDGIRR